MRRRRMLSRIFAALMPMIALAAWAAPGTAIAGPDRAWQPRPELLVRTAWLAEHGQAPGLRIVDLRSADAFAAGHVPGAAHLSPDALFATVDGVEGMLPPHGQVAAALEAAGIGDETSVIAYDDANGLYAARLFWVLDYLGRGNGRVLDGGWPLWQRQGRPVARDAPAPVAARFTPRPRPEAIADLAWMRAHLEDANAVYVDARSRGEYHGVLRYAAHRGHIPGAVSMDWKRHLNPNGTLRPPKELRAEYEQLGVTPAREVAVYCQVLVRASHSYFVLKWLGLTRVRGYDGSWAEWGNRDDTPKALL